MAAIFDVTTARLRQMADEGMPKAGPGLYPLGACVQWYVDFWRSRAIDRAADRGSNTAKDRTEEARAVQMEARAARETGMWVSKSAVAEAQQSAVLFMAKAFEAMPTALGRECHLPPEAVRKMRARLDDVRKNFARDAAAYLTAEDDAIAESKKTA